jgi:uncharacterized membrane protein
VNNACEFIDQVTRAMSDNHVLYLGDAALSGAAAYLAGLMTAFGIGYDYVPSDVKLFILSDYPSSRMLPAVQEIVLKQVHDQAAGLLMIGGWESFRGHGGDWNGTPIGNALPVEISGEDDRVNCDQPALILAGEAHDITAELPWASRPPTIGGFNRVIAKPGSATPLLVQRFSAAYDAGRFQFMPRDQHPLLVIGAHGFGLTAALMTDLSPHWVGGFVDWGDAERITAQAPGGWPIEVGNLYSQFIANLLTWTGQLATQAV